MFKPSVQSRAYAALVCCDVAEKCTLTFALHKDVEATALDLTHPEPIETLQTPGRPARPELVSPKDLQPRKLGSVLGRATLLHAVAHIEFNAINLALDAIYRFPDMPASFYADWASVAADEARHFQMLQTRLQALEFQYGDFPAHNGLWDMAQKTAHDVRVRMALVPRLLEARGLDVTPGMMDKLRAAGDSESVAILDVILREEVRHVEIGSRWFAHLCAQAKLDVHSEFIDLLSRYAKGMLRGPFNRAARKAAGFSDVELDALEAFSA
jgi:uncharacterized ferritin-like protein (DUF455 family)